MAVIIKSEGYADGRIGYNGMYLRSYDPEAYDGRGHIEWTNAIERAKRFPDHGAAFECWKTVPACHPVRLTDGKPNRPLTAFTVMFETVPA
jgi:hypothetical protein